MEEGATERGRRVIETLMATGRDLGLDVQLDSTSKPARPIGMTVKVTDAGEGSPLYTWGDRRCPLWTTRRSLRDLAIRSRSA